MAEDQNLDQKSTDGDTDEQSGLSSGDSNGGKTFTEAEFKSELDRRVRGAVEKTKKEFKEELDSLKKELNSKNEGDESETQKILSSIDELKKELAEAKTASKIIKVQKKLEDAFKEAGIPLTFMKYLPQDMDEDKIDDAVKELKDSIQDVLASNGSDKLKSLNGSGKGSEQTDKGPSKTALESFRARQKYIKQKI